jgi:hypothetical protein
MRAVRAWFQIFLCSCAFVDLSFMGARAAIQQRNSHHLYILPSRARFVNNKVKKEGIARIARARCKKGVALNAKFKAAHEKLWIE